MVEIKGETYPAREILRGLNAVWNKEKKVWEYEGDLEELKQRLAENGFEIEETDDKTVNIKTVWYKVKGNTYEIKNFLKKIGRWNREGKYWKIPLSSLREFSDYINELNKDEDYKASLTIDEEKKEITVAIQVARICAECGQKTFNYIILRDSNGIREAVCDDCYDRYYAGTSYWERSWY